MMIKDMNDERIALRQAQGKLARDV